MLNYYSWSTTLVTARYNTLYSLWRNVELCLKLQGSVLLVPYVRTAGEGMKINQMKKLETL